MDRKELICIGHITHDKVVTPRSVVHMAGGTAFYFSNAVSRLDIRYKLITALAEADMPSVFELREQGIDVTVLPSAQTVYFENIYSGNQDHRTQRVIGQADPFTADRLTDADAMVFHLGPLLAGDIPVDVIRTLAAKGKVSLDAQGYLREVKDQNVLPIDWCDKIGGLQYIHTLKVNEYEMAVLTGQDDIEEGARLLAGWGVKEVVITLGSMGSVIFDGQDFHTIPAYIPTTSVVDATGCGDTYMAGYLYQRIKGASIQQAGEFAAAMATLKIEGSGPFTGTRDDVLALLASRKDKVYR
ncbi:MAG TPA: PfkB family carbohydrate kinase [Puia sp.]|uniref:PfkB family carbohydrate kinase n=1 Tax=Puia sp. TaxID=2045100 RepID=UPI002BB0A3B5|nr:PfkB family carbohydrate kinase [Puia sp.]HVU96270.1 PfkB family carbohydrate kinase [Puia sp.]